MCQIKFSYSFRMDLNLDLNKNYSVREEINECINSLTSPKEHDIKNYLSCFSETLTGQENENKKSGKIKFLLFYCNII